MKQQKKVVEIVAEGIVLIAAIVKAIRKRKR